MMGNANNIRFKKIPIEQLFSPRRKVLIVLTLITIGCSFLIELNPLRLFNDNNLKLVVDFLGAAFTPAIDYENPVPDAEPFLITVVDSVLMTLRFALLAMSVSIPIGALLAFFSTTAWWPKKNRRRQRQILMGILIVSKSWITFARSIHELIWGLLFITAMGTSTTAAIVAVSIPFSGILAKIYSEIIEEHSRDVQELFRSIGAGTLSSFCIGIIPQALPDLFSYTFYRLECALRTATVFGFLGIETVGYRIMLSSNEFHHHEVWTYLYVLFGTIAILEWWSRSIRKRLGTSTIN